MLVGRNTTPLRITGADDEGAEDDESAEDQDRKSVV